MSIGYKVATNLIIAGLFAMAIMWAGMQTNTATVAEARPSNVPTWNASMAKDFPTCTAEKALTDNVLVVDVFANVKIVDFDKAWKSSQTDTGHDDVWVVGWC